MLFLYIPSQCFFISLYFYSLTIIAYLSVCFALCTSYYIISSSHIALIIFIIIHDRDGQYFIKCSSYSCYYSLTNAILLLLLFWKCFWKGKNIWCREARIARCGVKFSGNCHLKRIIKLCSYFENLQLNLHCWICSCRVFTRGNVL